MELSGVLLLIQVQVLVSLLTSQYDCWGSKETYGANDQDESV